MSRRRRGQNPTLITITYDDQIREIFRLVKSINNRSKKLVNYIWDVADDKHQHLFLNLRQDAFVLMGETKRLKDFKDALAIEVPVYDDFKDVIDLSFDDGVDEQAQNAQEEAPVVQEQVPEVPVAIPSVDVVDVNPSSQSDLMESAPKARTDLSRSDIRYYYSLA